MKERFCPVCGQNATKPFWRKASLQLVRCRRCSMVYVSPVPEEFDSGSFYARRTYYVSPAKLDADFAPVRFERELRLFRRWCPRGVVLDVGCSTGGFLHQLATRYPEAYDALGIDVAEAALNYAKDRGLSVLPGQFLDLGAASPAGSGAAQFPDRALEGNRDWAGPFDAITFWAVLEHLANPGPYLVKAAELLKPGGHCFVVTPNLHSLAARVLKQRYRYILPEHLNYFSPVTLKALGYQARELDIVDAGSTHFNPLVIWSDFWSRRTEVPEEERAALLQRTTQWKQSPALRPVKLIYDALERCLGSLNLADNIYLVLRRRVGQS